MFGSTMVLTIGTALDRAKDEELTVRMCIGGEWISGRILSSDGMAVAVHESSGDICVVRKDTISCVRMPSRAHTSHVPTQHSGGAGQQVGVLEGSETVQA